MRIATILIIATICAALSVAHAVSPPVPPALDKRVAECTLVIVGTITNVGTVMVEDSQWSRWASMTPRASKVSSNVVGALTIMVDEMLYAKEPVNTNTVLYLFGDWGFNTADLDNYKGTKQIFILSKNSAAFVSAYSRWRLCEPLEKRAEIVEVIKKHSRKKEAPNQSAAANVRPASPFQVLGEFVRGLCDPPFCPAHVAALDR